MSLKTRLGRLEAGRPDKYVPSSDPAMEQLNRAVFNLRKRGITWVDVLKSMSKRTESRK